MKEMEVFKNAELGSVRVVMVNEEPYFVGKDVAEILCTGIIFLYFFINFSSYVRIRFFRPLLPPPILLFSETKIIWMKKELSIHLYPGKQVFR